MPLSLFLKACLKMASVVLLSFDEYQKKNVLELFSSWVTWDGRQAEMDPFLF